MELTEFDQVNLDIEKARELGDFEIDVSNKDGYEKSKRFVLDVTAKMRKAVNDRHKEVKAPVLAESRKIDSAKKELLKLIDEIEEPHKLAYKERDKKIKEAKEAKIDLVDSLFLDVDKMTLEIMNSQDIDRVCAIQEELQCLDVDPTVFRDKLNLYIERINTAIDKASSKIMELAKSGGNKKSRRDEIADKILTKVNLTIMQANAVADMIVSGEV